MYELIRRIHLYSAFVVLSFLVMYFVTGYPMIHQAFMERQDPEKQTRVYPLDADEAEGLAFEIKIAISRGCEVEDLRMDEAIVEVEMPIGHHRADQDQSY